MNGLPRLAPFLALARASPPQRPSPRPVSPRALPRTTPKSNQPTDPRPSSPRHQPPREPAPPPAPAEQTTRTTTIRNHVNLKKSTLEVVPASPDRPNLLTVKFTFDANVDCWASVFPVATEHPKEGCRLTTEGEGRAPPARSSHPRGLGQRFESAAPIDVAAFDEKTLTESGANQFPLVIRLECITGEPKPQEAEASEPAAAAAAAGSEGTRSNTNTTNPFGPPPPSGERDPLDASDVSLDDATDRAGGKKEKASAVALPEPAGASLAEWVQSQTTYATLVKKDDGSWGATVLKQKIWVDGTSYELQEIFGIENCSAGVPLSEQGEGGDEGGESGKECVVCLSETRDTTVLPCRHMCMCSGCARMLRHQSNRCPICRTPVESLLEIKVARKAPGAGGGGEGAGEGGRRAGDDAV